MLYMFKKMKGYWKMKLIALDHPVGRTRFARGYGPDVRQTTK